MRVHLLITFFLISLFSGCVSTLDKELFKFNENDFIHIQAYKPGDTLFFENKDKQIDSFLILDYETEIRGQKQGLMSTKPESDFWLCITQLDKEKAKSFGRPKAINGDTIESQWLVSLVKYPPNQTVHYDFSFLTLYTMQDSIFGEFHTDTLHLNEKFITNYYSIPHDYPERLDSPTDVEELLWTDKDGLVAYRFKNGMWWTKKSSR
jgi:hypothetical protein